LMALSLSRKPHVEAQPNHRNIIERPESIPKARLLKPTPSQAQPVETIP
jgi:hypothetical protein